MGESGSSQHREQLSHEADQGEGRHGAGLGNRGREKLREAYFKKNVFLISHYISQILFVNICSTNASSFSDPHLPSLWSQQHLLTLLFICPQQRSLCLSQPFPAAVLEAGQTQSKYSLKCCYENWSTKSLHKSLKAIKTIPSNVNCCKLYKQFKGMRKFGKLALWKIGFLELIFGDLTLN